MRRFSSLTFVMVALGMSTISGAMPLRNQIHFEGHNQTASPPWYVFASTVKSTLGEDPCLKVHPLEGSDPHYILPIQLVCEDPYKGLSVSTAMTRVEQIGNVDVKIVVKAKDGHVIQPQPFAQNVSQAITLYNTTLSGNPLYVKLMPGNAYYSFFILFAKKIVQFYADNMGDAYRNKNLVAADAFSQALALRAHKEFNVGVSTAVEP